MVARQSDKCRSILRLSPILYGKKHMGQPNRASAHSRATHVDEYGTTSTAVDEYTFFYHGTVLYLWDRWTDSEILQLFGA